MIDQEIRQAFDEKQDEILTGMPVPQDGKIGDIRTNITHKGKFYQTMKAGIDTWLFSAPFTRVPSIHTMDDYLLKSGGKMLDGAHIAVDEIRARDSDGLKLYEDGGIKGLKVLNSGDVQITDRLGVGTPDPGRKVEIYAASSILRLRDSGATANACLAYVEFGGTNAGAWSRTGFVGDSASANASIKLAAEVADLLLGAADDIILTPGGTGVGIGTDSPDMKFDVEDTTSVGISGTAYRVGEFKYNAGDKPGIFLGFDTAGAGVIAASTQATGNAIAFWTYTGASWGERMRITKGGYVGIGTSSPDSKLDITAADGEGVLIQTPGEANTFLELNEGLVHGGRILLEGNSNLIQFQSKLSSAYTTPMFYYYAGTHVNKLFFSTSLNIKERASAPADLATYGQLWIKSDTPNILMYTDDAGNDFTVDVTAA